MPKLLPSRNRLVFVCYHFFTWTARLSLRYSPFDVSLIEVTEVISPICVMSQKVDSLNISPKYPDHVR